MRTAHFLPALSLILCATLSATGQSFYKKYFPPDNIYSTIPWSASQRPDGKYWLASGVYEAPSRLYITGIDEQGEVFTSIRLSADQNDSGEGYVSGNMVATGDNGCAALLSQSISAQSDGWILVKMSANAGVEWAKEIAGVGVAGYGVDFLHYSADGIWVYSRLWALGNGLSQSYFARVALDGTVLWERVLALPSFLGTNTTLLPDGRLLAILNTGSLAPLGHLLALTPDGDLQPIVTIQNTVVMDAVQHDDGRLFFIGHTPDIGTTESSLLLGCYQSGQFQWVKNFSLSKEFYTSADVLLNAAQDSLTVAVSNTAAGGVRYMLRFDLSGQLAWARWLPSFENLQSHTSVTADGGFLWVSSSPDLKPLVAKTNADGQVPDCALAQVCQIDIRDSSLLKANQNFNFQTTVRMQNVPVSATQKVMQSQDYCAPLPLLDATIYADSLACRNAELKLQLHPDAAGYSEWRFPGVLANPVVGVTEPVVIFPDTGTFNITHLLTLAGCRDTAEQTIRILPLPEVQLPGNTLLCPGDTLTITADATPDVSYHWDNGSTAPERIIAAANAYGVTVSNAAGCTASDQVLVSPAQVPGVFLPADTFFCENGGVVLSPKIYPGWEYHWNDGYGGVVREVNQQGIYSLQALSPDGCQISDSIAVALRIRPDFYITVTQPDTCGRQVLSLEDDDLQHIRWSTGTAGKATDVLKSGTYSVTASDGFCDNTVSTGVEINSCPECFVYFPNVIKPDAGGGNGVFGPQTGCLFTEYHLHLLDRWGTLLFESHDAAQTWDGQFRGEPVPPGIYTFAATGTLSIKGVKIPFEKNGTVAVIR